MSTIERLAYEAEYHNSEGSRIDARKVPVTLTDRLLNEAEDFFCELIRKECRDKDVLNYGCGEGGLTTSLINWGARSVTGIDISPGMIKRAYLINSPLVKFRIMNCEELEFPDDSFDLIVGMAILHHLDLARSIHEIKRVLKPGGTAVFFEPLGYNFFINLFRCFTPKARTPYEHPLKRGDLAIIRRVFKEVKTKEFVLFPLFIAPIRFILPNKIFTALLTFLKRMDIFMWKHLIFTRRWYWVTVMELKE